MTEIGQPKRGSRLELAYLHGGEVVGQPGQVLGPRQLADFELVYVIEGGARYHSDGDVVYVPPGGFILGRPGSNESYQWGSAVPTRHAFFHFGVDIYPADWPEIDQWPRTQVGLSPVCPGLFRHILQHIYEHDDWPAVRPRPRDCRLVEVLIDTFIEAHGTETVSFDRDRPEPVCRALMLMRNRVEEAPLQSLPLSDLAAQAHVTEKHLCRLFERSLGYSPMKTFTLMKLQVARPLLVRTNLSISEIAARCGFDNPLYFSRRFSALYGCPPSEFRARLRSGKIISMPNPLPVDLMPRTNW